MVSNLRAFIQNSHKTKKSKEKLKEKKNKFNNTYSTKKDAS